MAVPNASKPKVELQTYCMVFQSTTGKNPKTGRLYADEICNDLHSNWRNAGKDVFIMLEKPGVITSTEYKEGHPVKQYRLSLAESRQKPRSYQSALGYFIAGAFGIDAIPLRREK